MSEDERGFLAQFLPEGSDPDEIVCKLLDEENFHFGNPFLKWQVFLCLITPDGITIHTFENNMSNVLMETFNYSVFIYLEICTSGSCGFSIDLGCSIFDGLLIFTCFNGTLIGFLISGNHQIFDGIIVQFS